MDGQDYFDEESYEAIRNKYGKFLKVLDDSSKEPVRVFDDLGQRQKDDIALIRNISEYLQGKKDEDVRKQAAKEEELASEVAKPKENGDVGKEKVN